MDAGSSELLHCLLWLAIFTELCFVLRVAAGSYVALTLMGKPNSATSPGANQQGSSPYPAKTNSTPSNRDSRITAPQPVDVSLTCLSGVAATRMVVIVLNVDVCVLSLQRFYIGLNVDVCVCWVCKGFTLVWMWMCACAESAKVLHWFECGCVHVLSLQRFYILVLMLLLFTPSKPGLS